MKTRKSTQGIVVAPYIEMRDRMITEIINNAKNVYGKSDPSLFMGIVDLTTNLQVADPKECNEFVQDMWGFMLWAKDKDSRSALTTIIHDLGEFSRNRHQAWFCPRTSGYRKYLPVS